MKEMKQANNENEKKRTLPMKTLAKVGMNGIPPWNLLDSPKRATQMKVSANIETAMAVKTIDIVEP